ncbi:MAG: hypothetical protein A2Z72_02660 [Omnitrophica bacterium RBG_13_46_9]|nr:MAG: hypothetical protein A2Z72_02660 [Omnitrophica bacterium RBG_13_46_9]
MSSEDLENNSAFKKRASLLILVPALFLCLSTGSFAEVVDKILVIVNDEIITQNEVDKILMPIYAHYKNTLAGAALTEKIAEARRNVLQRLVQDKLLLTEAKKMEVKVTDEEAQARIKEIKGRFATDEEFETALAQESLLLSELEKKYRERIMIDKLVDSVIRKDISLTPNEITTYYNDNTGEFTEPQKVKLRSILIKLDKGRTDEEALELAKEVLRRLEEGGDFGLLAKEYSDGPYAGSGGDMGWVKDGELMDRINVLVFSMNAGELSGVLKTNLGFHIFKVEEKTPSRMKEFREVKHEIEQFLYSKKVNEKLGQWIEELKKDAYIAFR